MVRLDHCDHNASSGSTGSRIPAGIRAGSQASNQQQVVNRHLLALDAKRVSDKNWEEERLVLIGAGDVVSIPRVWSTCQLEADVVKLAFDVLVERGVPRPAEGDKILQYWVSAEGGKFDYLRLIVKSVGVTEGVTPKNWREHLTLQLLMA